jgi:hypothetical protein
MQAIWPGRDGVGQACLAPPDAGIVRGEVTNCAQAGTCGTGPAGSVAMPRPASPGNAGPGGLGDGEPEPPGPGDGEPEPTGPGEGEPEPTGLGEGEPEPIGPGEGEPEPIGLGEGEPELAGPAAAEAAVTGAAVPPITASTAIPAGTPMPRVIAGSTGPRHDHPPMRMNPPQAWLIPGEASCRSCDSPPGLPLNSK